MISVKIDLHTDLSAVALGVPVVQNEARPITMSETLLNLLEECRISKRPESYNLMKQTLEEFFALTRKNILSNITRRDLLKHKAWLMGSHLTHSSKKLRANSPRTAGNKMLRVNQYLRSVMGVDPGKGVVTVKDAKWVGMEPEVYDEKELEAFFKASRRATPSSLWCSKRC